MHAWQYHPPLKFNELLRDWPRWQSSKTLSSLPLRSTQKQQLFAEQPSIKKARKKVKVLVAQSSQFSETLLPVALSMEFSKWEYWSG